MRKIGATAKSGGVEMKVLFSDGTKKTVFVQPSALALLKAFGGEDAVDLLMSGKIDAIIPTYSNIEHNLIHGIIRHDKQAIFRLGQMYMRESAAAKLRSAAANVYGIARATLEGAADLIDEMETMA